MFVCKQMLSLMKSILYIRLDSYFSCIQSMAPITYFDILLAFICFMILWALRQPKELPWNWPIVGMVPSSIYYVDQVHEGCTAILGRSQGTFLFKGIWFANMDKLLTADPANIHHIMSANFPNFPKGPKFKNIFDVLGDGIFNSDSDSWRNQRKITRTLINHQSFHRFLVKTSKEKVEKGLIPVLDHMSKLGQVVDLQDLFQRFTFDTTCILTTGYDPGCLSIELPNVPFSKAMDEAEEAILFRHVLPIKAWKLQRWLDIGQEKSMRKASETLDKIIGNYISIKRKELEVTKSRKEEEGFDILTSYIDEEKTMGLKHDNKYLRDIILNLMIAGRDTTSSALTWAIWLVSTHPMVKEKIREELKANIPVKEGQQWRLFSTEELNKLVYLHGALCETLRLYPPVPFQHKEPLEADILPTGHPVHPKMEVMLKF